MKPVVKCAQWAVAGALVAGAAGVVFLMYKHRNSYRLHPLQCSIRRAARILWNRNRDAQVRAAAPEDGLVAASSLTGEPQCRPLMGVRQLLAWQPEKDVNYAFCRSSVPLVSLGTSHEGASTPKLLVCHDMMGNYLEDRFVQGSPDPSFYRLWHWDMIDVFCYFSHHMVTIPPPCWTNSCHRNNVQVLGTLITEGSEGWEQCKVLFGSKKAAEEAAEKLVAIAKYYGFDGWLLNIENALSNKQVSVVLHFTSYLRARLCEELPSSMLVWYDSVTIRGDLSWQNALTDLNKPFFDAAHELFTNYFWKMDGDKTPAATAARAGSKRAQVYMGVDVFGRGQYGGGKWNCGVAVAPCQSEGLSVALFAPGWVFEGEGNDRAEFEVLQQQFWGKLAATWQSRHATAWCLPFVTSFNRGCGHSMWLEGQLVSSHPWFQLSAQSPQPRFPPVLPSAKCVPPDMAVGDIAAVLTDAVAFHGGACLQLTGQLLPSGPCHVPLYRAQLAVPREGLEVHVAACCAEGCELALTMQLTNKGEVGTPSQQEHTVILQPGTGASGDYGETQPGPAPPVTSTGSAAAAAQVPHIAVSPQEQQLTRAGSKCSAALPEAAAGLIWTTCCYVLAPSAQLPGNFVVGLGVRCSVLQRSAAAAAEAGDEAPRAYQAYLGEVRVVAAGHVGLQPPPLAELCVEGVQVAALPVTTAAAAAAGVDSAGDQLQLSCTLRWSGPPGCHSCHIWAQPQPVVPPSEPVAAPATVPLQWLGQAFTDRFYVAQLLLPPRCSLVNFVVQQVTAAGAVQPQDAAATVALALPVTGP